MISQSIPQILMSMIGIVTLFFIMIYFSIPLTIVVLLGVILMTFFIKKIAGGSSRFFFRQQTSLGKVEGFAEELMTGQKVVKVFCHEDRSQADFDKLNNQLFEDSNRANKYAQYIRTSSLQHRQHPLCNSRDSRRNTSYLRRSQLEHCRNVHFDKHSSALPQHHQGVYRKHKCRSPTSSTSL